MCVILDKKFACALSVLLYGTGPSGKELYNSFHHWNHPGHLYWTLVVRAYSNDFGLKNEVALLMRLESTELCLGPDHCNEVVLLKRWP